jgi:Leucine carboxyl methyltransferase
MEDGGPSVTARWVAAHRLGFARVATDYGDPAADEALAADVAAGRAAPANRMHDYLAARTAFFDRTVTGALGRGVTQVVVGAAGYEGRARFQATVAALGEPARSTFEPAEAEAFLARTGWPLAAGASDGQPTAAGRDRLRAVGLLLASVGPPAAAPPQSSQPPQPSQPSQGHSGALPLSALLSQALAAGRPPVLFGGLEPYPDNWRASVRRPATLPHFPMVLHRGGYPDGS